MTVYVVVSSRGMVLGVYSSSRAAERNMLPGDQLLSQAVRDD